jgi:hypothetical protein
MTLDPVSSLDIKTAHEFLSLTSIKDALIYLIETQDMNLEKNIPDIPDECKELFEESRDSFKSLIENSDNNLSLVDYSLDDKNSPLELSEQENDIDYSNNLDNFELSDKDNNTTLYLSDEDNLAYFL